MASQSTIVTSATIAAGTVAAASLAVHRALSAGPYSSWSSVVFGSSSAPYSELNLSKPDSKDGKIHVDIHESGYSLTGTIEPGYERVVEAFLKNVAEGQEVGASYCFYVGGKPVVDLAGGLKDKDGREYDLKSVNQVFSSGKAIMSVVVAYCVSKGYFNYEMKVADVWPEFAQGNKHDVTVKDILQHRGGVGWFDAENRPTFKECEDLDLLKVKLERQKHNFDGVKTQSYHAVTRGYYINEILRRVHPKNYTARDILNEEILPMISKDGDPHGYPVYVSVPETPEVKSRIWDLTGFPVPRVILRYLTPSFMNPDPLPAPILKSIKKPNPIAGKSMDKTMPLLTEPDPVTGKAPGKTLPEIQNSWNVRRGQHTSFATLTNARAMARLAALIANGGEIDGIRVIDAETVKRAVEVDPWVQEDKLLGFTVPFTHGGWGVSEGRYVPNTPVEERWLEKGKQGNWIYRGWAGYGGSMMQWEQNRNIAYAYSPSALQISLLGDFRSARLLEASLEAYEAKGGK